MLITNAGHYFGVVFVRVDLFCVKLLKVPFQLILVDQAFLLFLMKSVQISIPLSSELLLQKLRNILDLR